MLRLIPKTFIGPTIHNQIKYTRLLPIPSKNVRILPIQPARLYSNQPPLDTHKIVVENKFPILYDPLHFTSTIMKLLKQGLVICSMYSVCVCDNDCYSVVQFL